MLELGPQKPVAVAARIFDHPDSLSDLLENILAATTMDVQAITIPVRSPGKQWPGLTLTLDDTELIAGALKDKEMDYIAEVWDVDAVDNCVRAGSMAPSMFKIPSPCITDIKLLRHLAGMQKPLLLEVGMSSVDQMDRAHHELRGKPLVMVHTVCTYPVPVKEMNLSVIREIVSRYLRPVGYKGNEQGWLPSVHSIGYGACYIEREFSVTAEQPHVLDKESFEKMILSVRECEGFRGSGQKVVYESELLALRKWRK